MTLRQLGSVEQTAGDHESAKKHLVAATESMRRLAQKNSGLGYQLELAITLRALANLQDAVGDSKSAQEETGEAVQILRELIKQSPDDAEIKEQLEAAQKTLNSTAPKQADAS